MQGIARRKVLIQMAILSFLGLLNLGAQGANLAGDISVDNAHTTYISLSDSSAGTQIANGADWTVTDTFTGVALTPGITYFLHVDATDAGGAAAFLGDFTLTGGGHTFAGNGGTTITTDTTWGVSTTGWLGFSTATSYGVHGVAPWGNRPSIDPTATWIWSSDNQGDNRVYFSMAIVPDRADLELTKTLDTLGPYQVGGTVQYTVTVTNNGPGVAASVNINDTPTNLTITNVSSTNCTSFPCAIASMANGDVEVITVTATIDAAGDFSNLAEVVSLTPESNNLNNFMVSSVGVATPKSIPTLSQWGLLLLSLLLLAYGFRQKNHT